MALLRGVLAILFGVGALVWPGITVLALVLVFGVYSLLDGLLDVAMTAGGKSRLQPLGGGLMDLFGIAAGLLGLVTTIGVFSIAWGVTLIVFAFRVKGLSTTGAPTPRPAS